MSDWEPLTLRDVISVKHGYAFPGAGFGIDASAPQVLTPGNFALAGGFQDAKPKSFVGNFPHEYLLTSGELVLTMTDLSKAGDTLGYAARLPAGREFLHNQRVGLVQLTDPTRLDLNYFHYLTRTASYRRHILATASGSTVKHTSPGRIGDFSTQVPPLHEQQAIVEVLGALDDKIAANTSLVSKCREYALALTRVHTPSTTLGNVVAHRSRQVDPSTMTTPHVDLFSLPAFDIGAGPERVAPSDIKSGKFLVEGSVVLVSKLNPRISRIWPIDEEGAEVPKLASTEFVVLDPLFCTPSFLWALLSQPEFTSALEGQVAGTSGSHQRVKPADLLAAPIPDPRQISPELHADVNAVLDPVKAALAENRTLAATRDALLPQLMSGKLRVRDAERIAEEAGA
jgi:type I restriction enzyme S subunit